MEQQQQWWLLNRNYLLPFRDATESVVATTSWTGCNRNSFWTVACCQLATISWPINSPEFHRHYPRRHHLPRPPPPWPRLNRPALSYLLLLHCPPPVLRVLPGKGTSKIIEQQWQPQTYRVLSLNHSHSSSSITTNTTHNSGIPVVIWVVWTSIIIT